MLKTNEQPVLTRFSAGGLDFFPNVGLSPMSGVTDLSFRRLCKHLAKGRIGILTTEFISVEGNREWDPKKIPMLRIHPDENPVGIQIFGHTPEKMAWAASQVQQLGANFVEINAGCPVPKVVGRGGGSALLKDLSLMAEILKSVKKAVSIPVFLKVRLGWCEHSINVLNTLEVAEGEGVDLFTIHGRTRKQGYNGLADWDLIGLAKKHAHIPVVGNGDIRSVAEAVARVNQTGVDGIGIGRAAMHNPWIFGQIADHWEGQLVEQPSIDDQKAMLATFNQFMLEDGVPETRILGRLKQIAARYTNCLQIEVEQRRNLLRSPSEDVFFERLAELLDGTKHENLFQSDSVQNLNGTPQKEIIEENQYS